MSIDRSLNDLLLHFKFEEFKNKSVDNIIQDALNEIELIIKKDIEDKINKQVEAFEELQWEKRLLESELHNYKNEFLDLKDSMINKIFQNTQPIMEYPEIGYVIECENKLPPKCDKCNDKRKIKYTSEDGNNTIFRNCWCAKTRFIYYPQECYFKGVFLGRNENKIKTENVIYKQDNKTYKAEYVYEKFSIIQENKSKNSIYKTWEECQKHCDYLNNK